MAYLNIQSLLMSDTDLQSDTSRCATDDLLGRCYLDATLLSEQCILSALPSIALLSIAAFRLHFLYRQDQKIVKNRTGLYKLILTFTYVFIQLTLLISWTREIPLRTPWTISASFINLAAAVALMPLSYLEHSRSMKPSLTLETYLLFSSVLDLPQIRTLFLQYPRSPLYWIILTGLSCKLFLLALESRTKTPFLKVKYRQLSPEWLSGAINHSFLWWLNGIFSSSYLDSYNGYRLDPALTTKVVGVKMRDTWDQRSSIKGRFPLIWTTYFALRGSFAYVLVPRLCLILFTFAQPFLIASVLDFIQKPNNKDGSYLLIIATFFIYLGIAVCSLQSSHALNRFIVIFRGAVEYILYDKTLLIKHGTYDESSAVTLMGADIDRVAFCLEELNECWSRIIEIGIGLPLLTRQLGWVSVVPLIVVGACTVGSSMVASRIGKSQREWSDATQSRIKITSSMLKEMKSIKMTGLTEVLGGLVQTERVKETRKMESRNWMIVWLNVVANMPSIFAPAATFGIYAIKAAILGSGSLDTVKAFTSLALISLVSQPAARLLSAIPNTAASIGCFDRIQEFLLADSHHETRLSVDQDPSTTILESGDLIMRVENATIKPSIGSEFILSKVSFSLPKGSFTVIAGAVGSGKSTLLKALLGEIECSTGTITVCTKKIAYCSQVPWLINGSIKEAICGYRNDDIDEVWYQSILSACELTYDISKLPGCDHTVIGSKGVALSGGQKHRIAIARAVYSRADIIILDDVLSALDKSTESSVVLQLFDHDHGLLRKFGCTVILVTHSAQVLPLADQVITLDPDGTMTFRTTETDDQSRLLLSKQSDDTSSQDFAVETKEEAMKPDSSKAEAESEAQDLKRKTGDWGVYRYYFDSIGFPKLAVFLAFTLLNVLSGSLSQIWLKWWTDHEGKQVALFAGIYFVLGIGYSLGLGGYAWAIAVIIAPSTGRKLHQVLLDTVLRAPQSFFTATNLGSILNRFSQDMSLIEGPLAYGILATTTNLLSSLAEVALIATGSPFVLFAFPVLCFVMFYLQKVYLRTSRQLRHLELESRAPLYTHFLETIEGITTIRAFGWQQKSQDLFTEQVDDSQKPYYLMFCIQNWLQLVLDLVSGGMAVLVVTLALNLRHWTSPGLLGIAMNNLLSFNLSLAATLSGWTRLETSLGAIARLKAFEKDTEIEAKSCETTVPTENWPAQGLLEIQGVSAEYSGSVKALRNINLKILPGQRVSICGRTGSGKSTLLSTILRLQDLTQGTIKIDSLDISMLQRTAIRKQISSIPQDALHVPGTIRFNTDPFGSSNDTQTIAALTKVDLWSILSERGGLDAEMLSDSLSKGQFQLLALARAMLQKRKLVLMDEATSSIDLETANKINVMMETEFKGSTILMVAHRKETILGAEIVVVIEQGEIVEMGEPGVLMEKEGSKLRALLQEGDK